MARVKGGNIHKKRRVKILKQAKGYFGSKHKLYKSAKEQLMHSLKYAYRDRRQNKREMRKLWITRINAACRNNDISYSKFIDGLNKAQITINRKMLSEIAINDDKAFANLVSIARAALEGKKVNVESNNQNDYSKLTVAELRKIASEKNVEGSSTMKKAELIEALSKLV